MLKKLALVFIFTATAVLTGCNDKVSGKFTGQWVGTETNPKAVSTITITEEGDHYMVRVVMPMFNRDKTYELIEDGNHLKSSNNRIEYTLVSPTELAQGNSTKVLWNKK